MACWMAGGRQAEYFRLRRAASARSVGGAEELGVSRRGPQPRQGIGREGGVKADEEVIPMRRQTQQVRDRAGEGQVGQLAGEGPPARLLVGLDEERRLRAHPGVLPVEHVHLLPGAARPERARLPCRQDLLDGLA